MIIKENKFFLNIDEYSDAESINQLIKDHFSGDIKNEVYDFDGGWIDYIIDQKFNINFHYHVMAGYSITALNDESFDKAKQIAEFIENYFLSKQTSQAADKDNSDKGDISNKSIEATAKVACYNRNALAVKFLDSIPESSKSRVFKLNQLVYDDPLGPSAKWLNNIGKTWEQIIDNASKPCEERFLNVWKFYQNIQGE